MSFFLNTIAETARRAATGDNWYHTENLYVLEIQSSPLAALSAIPSQAFIVFPLGPEQYTVSRVMRQSVTPTMGGLVAEERGLLWREITVSGSFRLSPRHPKVLLGDTSIEPEGPTPPLVPLSGPMWTKRLMRNFFEKYASLKANPDLAAQTKMIWHDLKTGDSWVVVPEVADIARTISRRMQYPFTLKFKAIADAQAILLPPSPTSLLDDVKGVISDVNAGLAMVSAAINEGSRILGEVRVFVATIDSIIDKLNVIVDAAQNFVDGVTATMSVGATFISSTAELLESSLELMETTQELPNEVRQNYQMALDGLHLIGSKKEAFGTAYDDDVAPIARAEQGAAGDDREELEARANAGPPGSATELARQRSQAGDLSLVDGGVVGTGRPFQKYNSTIEYAVASTDTLQSIAAKFLNDGSLWYDIALFNGLQPPYISPVRVPGAATVGDIIVVPLLAGAGGASAVAEQGAGGEPGLNLLGTDMALVETAQSVPGRPAVTLAIDQRTNRDVKLISGVDNLSQALQMRIWTEQGSMPLIPQYGLPRVIGIRQQDAFIALLRISVRSTIVQDPRVQTVSALLFEVDNDVVEVETNVTPIGASNAQAIRTSLV